MNMEDIKSLINKYLEGETSEAEENSLREFFTGKDTPIPEEWRVYQALFTFETQEKAKLAEADEGKTDAATAKQQRKTVMRWIWAATAAASLTIIIAVSHTSRMPENYVVADGKIITTSKGNVTEEAEEALKLINTGNEDDFSALKMMIM
ncbi:hypothetical protein [Xylanibacter muris]|uniref:Anti sigma-E protein RseA N-terminal domain-containing protein n=2 Tax=Xylanibacter muris TaxID=2736290 RepID=A0ABX2ARQ4_9BACT|nr:hypothetical protein [Xylanibacter muris]NPD92905.1 hypothetical protein [Xylanibacter muris]